LTFEVNSLTFEVNSLTFEVNSLTFEVNSWTFEYVIHLIHKIHIMIGPLDVRTLPFLFKVKSNFCHVLHIKDNEYVMTV